MGNILTFMQRSASWDSGPMTFTHDEYLKVADHTRAMLNETSMTSVVYTFKDGTKVAFELED